MDTIKFDGVEMDAEVVRRKLVEHDLAQGVSVGRWALSRDPNKHGSSFLAFWGEQVTYVGCPPMHNEGSWADYLLRELRDMLNQAPNLK